MLQRGMKCLHLLPAPMAIAVPSPLEWPLLMAPERASAQPGSPQVSKICCFLAAESSGQGAMCPGGGSGQPSSPCPTSSGSFPLPPLQGPARKVQHQEGLATSTAKHGLPIPYLEFCLKLVAIWPLSKMMNSLGAGREQLRGSGKQREGKAGEIQG